MVRYFKLEWLVDNQELITTIRQVFLVDFLSIRTLFPLQSSKINLLFGVRDMNFSELIKSQRKERKMTQVDFSELLMVSSKTISNWESGRTLPDIDNVILIAKKLNISLDQLLLEDKKMINNIKDKAKKQNIVLLRLLTATTSLIMFVIIGHVTMWVAIVVFVAMLTNAVALVYFSNQLRLIEDKKPLNHFQLVTFAIIVPLLAGIYGIFVPF